MTALTKQGNETILYETQYNPESDRRLINTVLEAVAMLGERPVEALRKNPIHDSINIEAVEALLFRPGKDAVTDGHRRTVSFEYSGYQIHIHGDGRILLSEATDL